MLWILASVAFALLCYEIPTLITAVLWPLWNNPNVLQTDFHYYYDAAQRFAADSSRLYQPTDDVIAGFTYPPPAILPFLALSKLPLGAAFLLFTVASYAALLFAIRLWCAYLRRQGMAITRTTEIAVTVIAIALGPSYMNIMIGQVNAFVLASAVGFVWFAPLLPPIAALILAAGIWLKVYPIAMAAIGTWDRRTWSALAWTLVAAIVIAIGLLPIVPASAYRSFFAEVLPSRIDKTAIHITNQSLVACLERFRYTAYEFLNWTGHEAKIVSGTVRTIQLLCAGAAVAFLWMRSRQSQSSQAASAAGLIAMIAIFAPLGWGHTYVMVLPLVTLHLVTMTNARPAVAAVVVVCVALLMIPAGRHLPIDWSPEWIQNLVYSRYLLAAATLFVLPLSQNSRKGFSM